MTQNSEKRYLQAIGARILSEANDLKRTPEALAAELGVALDQIEGAIAGEVDRESAQAVLYAMAQVYPVSIADLWVEYDDTDQGVRITTAADSLGTRRVFDRRDRMGSLSPYYEYRDTAMSRTAPFKPEWIKELRVVSNSDPDNPDVAFNNGHLMHQATFFVGPVNFYWEINEQRHCVQLDTGDSNYITPFVPHSFASRDSNHLGLILAVTYGAAVRGALTELGRLDAGTLNELVGDPRRPEVAFVQLLARHAAAESLNRDQLIGRLVEGGFDRGRAHHLVVNGDPTIEETQGIAAALNIRPTDLMVNALEPGQEVVVRRRAGSDKRHYPTSEAPAYELTELARVGQQPMLKGFDVAVLGGCNGDMRHSLHEYVYNYGDVPAQLTWGDGRKATLEPGDSAYVRPMATHGFQTTEGTEPARLVMIRVPGALSSTIISEISAYDPQGRDRVSMETRRWF